MFSYDETHFWEVAFYLHVPTRSPVSSVFLMLCTLFLFLLFVAATAAAGGGGNVI